MLRFLHFKYALVNKHTQKFHLQRCQCFQFAAPAHLLFQQVWPQLLLVAADDPVRIEGTKSALLEHRTSVFVALKDHGKTVNLQSLIIVVPQNSHTILHGCDQSYNVKGMEKACITDNSETASRSQGKLTLDTRFPQGSVGFASIKGSSPRKQRENTAGSQASSTILDLLPQTLNSRISISFLCKSVTLSNDPKEELQIISM